MAEVTLNGLSFTTTGSNSVIVRGPGIQSAGIDLGNLNALSIQAFTSATSSPNVNPPATEILNAFTQQDVGTIQAGLADPPPPPPTAAETTTNTEQQNKTYKAEGGSDDDSGFPPLPADEVPPPSDTELQALAQTPAYQTQSNAGATPQGKSDTPAAKTVKTTPGRRRQNPLGNFSSYTYQLSLYMITPDAYKAFIDSGRRKIDAFQDVSKTGNGAFLIAQSGGINNTGIKRAPGFDVDYYIDNLKIKQSINGKDTQSATNVTGMSFTITEPYGFNFITRLKYAGQELAKVTKSKNFEKLTNPARQFFILGIRFQGYDANGNLISSKDVTGANSDPAGNAYGVFERYYDIMLTSMKFKIDGKAVVYNINAVSTPTGASFGIKNGVVWNGASVRGSTVYDALMGNGDGKIGLLTKLNQDQEELKKASGGKLIPMQYEVVFLGEAKELIEKASLVSPADLDKAKITPSKAENSSESNISNSEAKPDMNQRQIAFPSGTTIIQAIDTIIKQSQYLEAALKELTIATVEASDETLKQKPPRVLKWYNIGTEVTSVGYDDKQKDFAYKIKYIIQPYETPVMLSAYSNKTTPYYGPHKRYDYWFTGKNSEILKYEQTMDNTYFNVVLGSNGEPDTSAWGGDTDVPVKVNIPQGQAKQNGINTGEEAVNSVLTSLYDPGAYAMAKIQILGDPDFLMQTNPISDAAIYNQFYGTDGYTINPNGGQVFIEINFKEPTDYKNSTGLLNINENIVFWKYPGDVQAEIDKRGGGVSYMVLSCTSTFSNGQFIQDLEANINTFGDPKTSKKSGDAGRDPTTSKPNVQTTNKTGTASSGKGTGFQQGDDATGVDDQVAYQSALSAADQADAFYNNTKTVQVEGFPVQDDDAGSSLSDAEISNLFDEGGREEG